jgi:hypothetical protein
MEAPDPNQVPTVSGKALLPRLAVGCLLFAVVMSAGVYAFAQWTTPFFAELAKKNAPKAQTSQPVR